MINYALENVQFLPPEKPEETYPDDGPPPLTSMMNVTIQPSILEQEKEKKSIINLHCTRMKGSRVTTHGQFHTEIKKDEESQQMYGRGSQNLFRAAHFFTAAGWVFLRYGFSGL